MRRRLIAVSLVVCLLLSTVAVAPAAAQEDGSNAEFPDCETVRITGDAGYAEVYTSYYTERGGFSTDVISVDLSGDETVIGEGELYGGNVGSYQDEFVIDGVALFESDVGPMTGDFDNPNSQSCFDALPQPAEETTAAPETTTAPPATTTAADTETTTAPTSTPTTTESTSTPTTTDSPTSQPTSTSQQATETTAPESAAETTASPQGGDEATPSQDTDSGSSDGASDDSGVAERVNVSFSANASSGANETLVTHNVTGLLVNASEDDALTVNASEQAPNSTRAPTTEDDGFESLSYLTVNGTLDETSVENLSVASTVNESYLAALDGNASDVQFNAWDADNDTWVPVNTSVRNATGNVSEDNSTGNVSVVNATQNVTSSDGAENASVGNATNATATNVTYVFEADIGYGVYALGLNRSNVVVTDVTAPGNASVGETVTVEATVENTGRADGNHTATFSVAGEQVEESEVTIAANASATVAFDWQFETAGTHTVAVDNQTVDVNVSAAEGQAASPPDDPSADSMIQPRTSGSLGALDSGALVVLLSLVGAGLVAYRRAYR